MPPSVLRAMPSFVVAGGLSALAATALALFSPEFAHWFVVPLVACGALIGRDAVEWFRGRMDTFDPQGLLGLMGVHFFFAAPLLHVAWSYWLARVIPPPDWRDWLGYMALLNVAGLAAYRVALGFGRGGPGSARSTTWRPSGGFFRMAAVAVVLTAALQVGVFAHFGGISGYIENYRLGPKAFQGYGWVFMLSESCSILLALSVVTYLSLSRRSVGWGTLIPLLALFVVLQVLVGGLRGSRSHTVMALFWVVGAVHYLVRPVPRRLLYAGALAMLAFMYVYGFYKSNQDVSAAFSERRRDVEQTTGRTLPATILGDLGRADVQAYILYRYSEYGDLRHAWGRTYLHAAMLLIPQSILPRPEGKAREGTEILYGPDTYDPDRKSSSRVYGLAGEAMLNFSPFAVPLGYALLGFCLGRLRRWTADLPAGDLRLLLAPFGALLCLTMLSGDLDNLVFLAVASGLVPAVFIAAVSVKHRTWAEGVAAV